ncbi:Subunit of Golgi mannosyltransferase complex [Handroanthus impetiginosus]|uniref:Subunit of Golgi mannosyltransferase complex n=1 Tax=Handroanthus impetiginosus TaxID=429701 RepID=A0A2G9GJ10_9LAMI|nr:Subunit of Golgi mannosyltransferase complex [Handroanthus impetiginosus]
MGLKRISSASGTLPTTTARGGGRAATTARRRYQDVQKCSNLKLTILCGVITVLVFRGTIGISYFSPLPENGILKEEADRIVAEIRSGDYDNDYESRITSNGSYTFGPKIINWDISRKKWLQKNPRFLNQANGRPRILLLTGSQSGPCNNPIGDHYLLKAIKNKVDYCRMHDIEIVYNMANLEDELSGHWTKLTLIRKIMLSHPEVEWIWWMDSDTFFTDMFFKLPISKYEGYNMVVHGYHNLLFDEHSWTALSTGSFLLRNCQWSLDLLDSWAPMGAKGRGREEAGKILTQNLKGRPEFEADDQSALIYLLISRKDELVDKVFLENSYYLHGFWVGLVDRYEEFMEKYKSGSGDERWPFVTHFVGCKSCGGYGDYKLKRCVKSMERAFNFADNQVLKLYGFSHRGLLSPNIKMIRNETSRLLGVRDHVEMET